MQFYGYTISKTADFEAYERVTKYIVEEMDYELCGEHGAIDVFWRDFKKGDSRIRLTIDEFSDYVIVKSYDELQIECEVKWESFPGEKLIFDD